MCIRGCTPANAYIFATLYTHDVAKYLYIRIQDVSEIVQQAISVIILHVKISSLSPRVNICKHERYHDLLSTTLPLSYFRNFRISNAFVNKDESIAF